MKRLPILYFVLFIFYSSSLATLVTGRVEDGQNGEPLPGVNIYFLHTPFGSSTSEDGVFSINGLSPGKYLVTAQRVGYQATSFFFEVKPEENASIDIKLDPSVLELNSRIVTTASRYRDEAFNLADAVGMMDNRSFNERIPRSLPEAMIGMTGVWMQKTNHGGGSPFVRGLTGNQALILVDGIRLNNATFRYGPNQYLNTIDPFHVQQVEVIRGSGSVLYGSDALGGTVQILTDDPVIGTASPGVSGESGIKYISDDMEKSGHGAVQLSAKDFGIVINASASDYGHIVAGGDLGTEAPSGYDQYAWSMKAKKRLGQRMLLTAAVQYLRQDDVPRFDQVDRGRYTKYSFDPQIRMLTYGRLAVFNENPLLRQVVITASFHGSLEKRTKVRSGNPVVTRERDDVNTIGVSAEIHTQVSTNWQIVSGLEYYGDYVESWREDRDTESGTVERRRGLYADGSEMSSFAVYSSNTFSFNRYDIRAGFRYNLVKINADDEVFGKMELTPQALVGNLSFLYKLNAQYRALLSLNTGFRAPNINDISSFGSFDSGIEVPNGDLAPERTLTIETGMKKRGQIFSGAFYLYRTYLTDLMVREPATYQGSGSYLGDPVFRKENAARSYIEGLELEGEVRIREGLNLLGGIAYTYGQNTTDNEPVRRIPPLNGYVSIAYRSSRISWINLEWLAASKQDRLSGGDINDHRIPDGGTPGWNIFNLRARIKYEPVDLSVGIHNLLDEEYRMHGSGHDGYGRSLHTGLSLYF